MTSVYRRLTPRRLGGAQPAAGSPVRVQAARSGSTARAAQVRGERGGGASRLPAYATREGQFSRASPARREVLRELFLEAAKTDFSTAPNGETSHFRMRDLAVDYSGMNPEAKSKVLEAGLQGIGKTALFTSGAGLWDRGLNQVKALLPYNLVDLLTHEKFERLVKLSDINSAKGPADVLFVAGVREVPEGETTEGLAARIVAAAKEEAARILEPAKMDPRAINPVMMKFAKAATLSKAAGSFVPLIIGTSEQTHMQIWDFYAQFRKDYASRPLHADPEVQADLVRALKDYFQMSDDLNHHPIFGWQEGVGLLDATTGLEIEGTPRIGEGAGSAKAYLDHSGMTRKLIAMGKDRWQFENIEVLTDQVAAAGGHEVAGKRVSVVLVPQRNGYAGGNPYWVKKPDGISFVELHEQSAVPVELTYGAEVFNANTPTMPLDLGAPQTLGFEAKRGGRRVKNNVGNITHDVRDADKNATPHNVGTAGIGGEIGVDYENLKSYGEYRMNGVGYLRTHQDLLARDLRLARQQIGTVDWT